MENLIPTWAMWTMGSLAYLALFVGIMYKAAKDAWPMEECE